VSLRSAKACAEICVPPLLLGRISGILVRVDSQPMEQAMWGKITATATTWIVMGGLSPVWACAYRTVAASSLPGSTDALVNSVSGAPFVLGTGDVARLAVLMIAGLSLTVIGLYRRRALQRAPSVPV
jgi:hypothetical protein